MRLKNRREAGKLLVGRLEKYTDQPKTIVVALPRGGILTGYEVAKGLHLPLEITCPRKIGAPMNPEFAIGAITETGEGIFHDEVIKSYGITPEYIEKKVTEETELAQRRIKLYRHDLPPRDLKGKIVILVDDGLATGATVMAAIASIKKEQAAQIILAVPVAPPHLLSQMAHHVDELICLMTPPGFYAVGQFYEDFAPIKDQEVIKFLNDYWKLSKSGK